MKKIVAIGGGEIGRPGYPVETTEIDKEIIRLSGKKKPRLLFIPTASSDSESYYDVVKKHFGKKLGCTTDVIYLIKSRYDKEEIERKILCSDIIYVGGGNTLKMLKVWRKKNIDKILKKAYSKGIILSGVSAGAICWFKYGNSDSMKFSNSKAKLIRVKGLRLIDALCCPHYHHEEDRKKDLKLMMKKTRGVAIALDNCCAIEVLNNKYRIISSKKNSNAYRVYWKGDKFFEEIIKESRDFKPIKKLLIK